MDAARPRPLAIPPHAAPSMAPPAAWASLGVAMSAAGDVAQGGATVVDERVRATSGLRRFLTRPEMGSLAGVIAVFIFFALVAGNSGFLSLRGTASYLQVSAELGILAVAVSLLMIGGEFDLSIGSIIGASGMIIAILTVVFGVE